MAAVVSQAMLLKNDPELMKFKRLMDNVRRRSQAADSLLHLLVSRANGGVLKSSLFPTYGGLNIDGDEACEVFLEAQLKNKNVVVEASLGVFGNLVAGDLGNMGDDYLVLRRKNTKLETEIARLREMRTVKLELRLKELMGRIISIRTSHWVLLLASCNTASG
ncbi:hypothetical protein RvY_10771 [Ramazzottius varieornatus]|uniref:Uncharacterized protein n=1 Tax=Ramazzottius varieornatus TaxID=947166 RepID=A0A1D1VDW3_RAMVA|nr:hypothetical protein RvY_10771 [Ramazzottius varieornatus]